MGFDIGGQIIYCHEFNHANVDTYPYIQTANLPLRAWMTCTDTVSTTMDLICCAVASEGGAEDTTGYLFAAEGTVTAASGARTHILSIQPLTSFNGIANRSKLVPVGIDLIVTGINPVFWELCLGAALTTPTWPDANATYSAVEYDTAGTYNSGGSNLIVIASGYVAASASTKGVVSEDLAIRYPITLDAAGATRLLGRLTLLVSGIGGNSATRASMTWKEIR